MAKEKRLNLLRFEKSHNIIMYGKEQNMTISERLKKYRKDHNLTQHEMAKVVGISIRRYNAIENGDTHLKTATVDKLARTLKISVKTVNEGLL